MHGQNYLFKRRYSLTLEFEVELSQEIAKAVDDEDRSLDEDEQGQRLACIRELVSVLLTEYREQLDIWSRDYILQDLGETDEIDLWGMARELRAKLPSIASLDEVIEQAEQRLPPELTQFLAYLRQENRLEDVVKAINLGFDVRLVGSSLQGQLGDSLERAHNDVTN